MKRKIKSEIDFDFVECCFQTKMTDDTLRYTLGYNPSGDNYVGPPAAEDSDPSEWDAETLREQPPEIKRKLFKHQLKSVYDMEKMEKCECIEMVGRGPISTLSCYNELTMAWKGQTRTMQRFVGIQADPVGYGKTLSMVTLIARDKMPWDLNESHVVDSQWTCRYYKVSYDTRLVRINTTLILTSHSCFIQWLDDLGHVGDALKVITIKSQKDIARFKPSDAWDVAVVTPTMYNRLILSQDVAWKRFIFDEPAQVKVRAMKEIVTGFTWLVSATPGYIARNQSSTSWVGRLARDFGWNRGVIQNFVVRNPTRFVQTSFDMPETVFKDYICWQPLARHLNGLVPTHINRMVQAGDIQGAIDALGGGQTNKINLVEILKARKQRDIEYVRFHLQRWENVGESAERGRRLAHWRQRLEELQSQLQKLDDSCKEDLESNCPICMDELVEPLLEPQCGQLFCAECLLTWAAAHNTCPHCRRTLDATSLVHVTDESKNKNKKNPDADKPLTKLQCIKKIVKIRTTEDANSKFIIASQYIGGYTKIKALLDEMKIPWCVIAGAVATRDKKIKQFQAGPCRAIFISNLDSTAGVNLQAATDIILFNEMPDSIRTQIIGRANRIGRNSSVVVHTLFTDNGRGGRMRERSG